MKTLLILRHAKSSWAEPGLSDHDRPLNGRGKLDAPKIGALIGNQELVPELILSSTAKRARKTAEKVAANCGYDKEIELRPGFYLAAPDDYLTALAELDDACNRVLVVGHNPGLEDLLETLTGSYETMATASLAHVSCNIATWRELDASADCELVEFWRPRELEE